MSPLVKAQQLLLLYLGPNLHKEVEKSILGSILVSLFGFHQNQGFLCFLLDAIVITKLLLKSKSQLRVRLVESL